MKYIDLSKYAPSISEKEDGRQIYQMIIDANPSVNEVEIDMSSIKAMATFCAKQIFGTLYKELTPSIFYKNIKLRGVSKNVKLSIMLGIEGALTSRN